MRKLLSESGYALLTEYSVPLVTRQREQKAFLITDATQINGKFDEGWKFVSAAQLNPGALMVILERWT